MKRAIAILAILTSLASCATAMLPTNPTPKQQKEAMCKDAQFGFILASSMLQTPKGGEESNYWMLYKQASKAAIETYCLN